MSFIKTETIIVHSQREHSLAFQIFRGRLKFNISKATANKKPKLKSSVLPKPTNRNDSDRFLPDIPFVVLRSARVQVRAISPKFPKSWGNA